MLRVFYLNITDPVFSVLEAGDFRPWMEVSKFAAVLSFRNDKVRREKWLGEWLLRSVLLRVYCFAPEDYALEKAEGGKPFLSGRAGQIYFNLSHSGDYVVCAFSDSEVGVDIERIGSERMGVARRFFHPDEIRSLENAEEVERREMFFKYWSVKESFLKYKGTGLRCPLSSFAVVETEGKIRIRQGGEYESVYIRECFIDPGYKCFVCSEVCSRPEIVRLTEWQAFPVAGNN